MTESKGGKRDMRLQQIGQVQDLVLLAIRSLPKVHALLISRDKESIVLNQ